jgi:predicted membrane-bound spermidine synthase
MRRPILLSIFVVSGFTSLIYESIWSHYLKLFLGHAAYAQTLVLVIFMGGMAIGSWLISRRSLRIRRLLLGYVIIEAIIGLCGLVFHRVFISATDWSFDSVIPSLSSPVTLQLFKWSLGTVLILPQSILLGMTFPLISNGIIRRWPERPGEVLSMLYFTNSLGAAIGVLVSGFVLIEAVGLPGTILTAAVLNIALALAGWAIVRGQEEPRPDHPPAPEVIAQPIRHDWFVWAAFLTGTASFFYEIGWIRMLSLVLGSSTHSFELMLSAFIFGLACGGLWMRRRIERIADARRYLGIVMLVMGLLALLTLPAYNVTFSVMESTLHTLNRTESGYTAFNFVSHAIAIAIMLPATFCAGMTLPLMTAATLRSSGERAIGTVYAANTLGAIVGVLIAVHVVMPYAGVKGVIIGGASVHIALGVAGIVLVSQIVPARRWAVTALGVGAILLTAFAVKLDPLRLASAVYRTGFASLPAATQVISLRDGKTATISVVELKGARYIATNGKTDAAIQMAAGEPAASDEITMVLAAALPLSLHERPARIANIGFGSGLTSSTLLADKRVAHLDSIEIEPYMVRGAREAYFPRIRRVFEDPRSRIVYDDAKTFFSSERQPYDIIVSEPSNPWVSGVATLFSDEFYRRITRHLAPDGYFVQWLQVYETDLTVFASVTKALSKNFASYALYVTDESDVLIVASQRATLPDGTAALFESEGLRAELKRVGLESLEDIRNRRVGTAATLDKLFSLYPVPANSDYFPYIDTHAARLRYEQRDAVELPSLLTLPVPVVEILTPHPSIDAASGKSLLERDHSINEARLVRDAVVSGKLDELPPAVARDVLLLRMSGTQCQDAVSRGIWRRSLRGIANLTLPFLKADESEPIWILARKSDCYSAGNESHAWPDFLAALAARDSVTVARLGLQVLSESNGRLSPEEFTYVITATAASQIASGDLAGARSLLDSTWNDLDHASSYELALRTLIGIATNGQNERPST